MRRSSLLLLALFATACGPVKPTLPAGQTPWATGDAVLAVRTSPCTLVDSHHQRIVTPALLPIWINADGATWHDWLETFRKAKVTHLVVTPSWRAAKQAANVRGNPAMFHAFLTALLREGFVPVVVLYDANDDHPDTSWFSLMEGFRDLWGSVLVVPSWALPKSCYPVDVPK